MAGVYLCGVGLCSALGMDAASCVTAMLAGQRPTSEVELRDLNEPLAAAFYRIADGAALFDTSRFEQLLPTVVEAALNGLPAMQRRALPVYIGSSCFSIGLSEQAYAAALRENPATAIPMPQCGYDYLPELVRRIAGSRGETYAYNTACTASANALLAALRALKLGWHRHALVVGAELANRTTLAGFSGLQLLSRELRPFDVRRDGIVLGEGLSAVLLSQDGEGPCILGGASNCDTHSVTTANPDGRSVAAVLRRALADAGLEAGQIRGIKGHGTATPAGDTAEAHGIAAVFDAPPPISVLKPYLGHTLGACGVNELVLYAGALQRGRLPATLGFEQTDAELKLQPLRESAPAPAGHYLLNYFGFGGNNAVLALRMGAA